jgi:thioredoxin reductase (NADPH)
MPQTVYDLLIVGAGPTGLFAGFYAGIRGMSFKIIDSLDQVGGQVSALYPNKDIFDVPAFTRVTGKEFIKRLQDQVKRFKPEYHLGQRVVGLTRRDDGVFELTTAEGAKHYSKTVLLALGMGSFRPKKHPNPEIDVYEGKGLQYGIHSLEPFKGKRVLVVGGGDSALDWALMLEPLCQKVTLIHRRDAFRAHESTIQKLKESKVDVKLWYELETVRGNGRVEEAVLFQNNTKENETLKVDFVLPNFGVLASLDFLKDWGLRLEDGKIPVNARMETNIPGVYAAGDICTHPGKLDLISTGLGEAATAANFVRTFLNPTEKAEPAHSSSFKW